MKNFLKIALVGAVVLTSCAKEEVLTQRENLAISFDTYIGKPTKGTPVTGTSFSPGATFGVYAYNSGDADFSATSIDSYPKRPLINEKVTKAADKWSYDNTAYYVANEKISFFAYSPHVTNAQFSAGKLQYEVSSDLEQQVDLMSATTPPTNLKWDGNIATAMPDIQFTFKHALSQIKFAAKTEQNYTDYTLSITNITLRNIKNSGSLALTGTDVEWSEQAGSQNYTTGLNANTIKHDAMVDLTSTGDHVFMLVPQTLTDAVFTFKISAVPTTEGTAAGKVEKTRDFDVVVASSTWEPCKIYKYNVTLTLDFDAPAIVFGEPSVTDWQNATDEEINNKPPTP